MDATELQARSGARCLTPEESDAAIMAACRHLAELTLAAGMRGRCVDRAELGRQCTGLLRLLAAPTLAQTAQHETHLASAAAPGVKRERNP